MEPSETHLWARVTKKARDACLEQRAREPLGMRENKNGARIKSLAQKMLHTSTTSLNWVPWLPQTSSQYALNKAQDNNETHQSKKQCKSTKDCQRQRMVGPQNDKYKEKPMATFMVARRRAESSPRDIRSVNKS